MKLDRSFSILVRIVLIFAFGAFLAASIRHVAEFYHDSEAPGTEWWVSYALAVSIDVTALILNIGLMFSSKLSLASKIFIWFFIVGLTGYSWLINWEYAVTFQQSELTSHLDSIWKTINPILASSFAFLNLAYALVAEVFSAKIKTLEDLQAELDELTGEKAQIAEQIRKAKGPGIITQAKEKALEIRQAAGEVFASNQEQNQSDIAAITPAVPAAKPAQNAREMQSISETLSPRNAAENGVEMDLISTQNARQNDPFFATISETFSNENDPITDPIPNPFRGDNGGDTDPEMRSIPTQNTGAFSMIHPRKKYSPNEAVKLPICKQNGVTITAIKTAIDRGDLIANKEKCCSKTALETWINARAKVSA